MKTAYQILRDKVKMNNFTFVEQEAICAAMEEYRTQFNKPPVYGQFVNPTEDEVMLFICDAYNVFVETRDKFKLMDFILDKTPHRIITRTQSDGLGDSSGSEKEFTSQEVFEWFQTKRFQREQGTQEYTMIYEIDLPKIINQFIKDKLA